MMEELKQLKADGKYQNKSVPDAKSKTQVKRINVQQGRPPFYGLGWFTTDKPLPDGDYGWRESANSKNRQLRKVEFGIYWQIGRPFYERDFSGEWCKIEFP